MAERRSGRVACRSRAVSHQREPFGHETLTGGSYEGARLASFANEAGVRLLDRGGDGGCDIESTLGRDQLC